MDLRGQITISLMPSVAAACGMETREQSQSVVEMRGGNFVLMINEAGVIIISKLQNEL